MFVTANVVSFTKHSERIDHEGREERPMENRGAATYVGREGRDEETKRNPRSRCWTGRRDPVGSTGSQRLSGSSVPTIGGEPGGEVSRAAPLAREARSYRPRADVEPCGKPANIRVHGHAGTIRVRDCVQAVLFVNASSAEPGRGARGTPKVSDIKFNISPNKTRDRAGRGLRRGAPNVISA